MSEHKSILGPPRERRIAHSPSHTKGPQAPPNRSPSRAIRWLQITLAAASLPTVLLVSAWHAQVRDLHKVGSRLKDARALDSHLQQTASRHNQHLARLAQLKERLSQRRVFTESLVRHTRLLQAVRSSAGDRPLWLTRLKADPSSILLEGQTGTFLEVSRFVHSLNRKEPVAQADLLAWVRRKGEISFTIRIVLNSTDGRVG